MCRPRNTATSAFCKQEWYRVSRTLRLTRLSPAMVHRIITGDYPASLNSASIRGSIPVDWDEQEKVLLQA